MHDCPCWPATESATQSATESATAKFANVSRVPAQPAQLHLPSGLLKPEAISQALALGCISLVAGPAPAAAAAVGVWVGVVAASVPVALAARRLQTGLCCFQCAAWHGRPQYLCCTSSKQTCSCAVMNMKQQIHAQGMWLQTCATSASRLSAAVPVCILCPACACTARASYSPSHHTSETHLATLQPPHTQPLPPTSTHSLTHPKARQSGLLQSQGTGKVLHRAKPAALRCSGSCN